MASSFRLFPDFPKEISGDLAWTGADFTSEDDFTVHLSADDIAEINAAVKHFLGTNSHQHPAPGYLDATPREFERGAVLITLAPTALGLARGLVSPATFPLSEGLATRLRAITDRVYNDYGFYRLRGLDPASNTETENVILYAGITSYVADKRSRNIGEDPPLLHVARLVKSWRD
jgi:hypothetical protein